MDDNQQTLDLDALLSIVRRRTPGTDWLEGECILRFGFVNTKAIVTAVNNFEAVAERCKRAEQSVDALKAGIIDVQKEYAELERQRDELLSACVNAWRACDKESLVIELPHVVARVRGMADGKA